MGDQDLAKGRPGVGEGELARRHLEQGDPDRIEIAAGVDGSLARGLLGGHVRRRAHHRARLGIPAADFRGELGDAEVHQLHHVATAGLLDQEDVVRLEVAVDDAAIVRRLQRAAALQQDGAGALKRHGPPRFQESLQRHAVQELHHEVVPAFVGDVEVEDLDDVVVADEVDRPRLVEEAVHHRLLGRVLRMQHLDRDLGPDGRVLAQIDGAHSAFAEELGDPVRADLAADHRVALEVLGRDGGPRTVAAGAGGSRIRHGTFPLTSR